MFIKNYDWKNLKKDIPAGIIVALVSIPISMGYALVAGLPPVYGLYGSWLPILVYGLITSSPRFVFGVDAAPAALVGGLLYSMEVAYQSEKALALVPLTALISGLWLLAFRLIRASRFVKFISSPVMGGFITGIGCTIILMQIPKLFGGDAGRGELPELLSHIAEELQSNINLFALAMGIGTIAVILVSKKFIPKVPMSVVVMAAGALIQIIFHVDRYGVKLLPAVEPGLPTPSLSFVSDAIEVAGESINDVVVLSLTIALVILAETLLATRNIGLRYGDRIDNEREVMAYAAGNLTAALFGCCPVNGSVSRTGIADQFGVRSQMMSFSASITMMLILICGTGFIKYLPVPVLTAIVISALIGILEFDLAKQLRHADKTEWWIFYAVLFTVLIFGTIYGVLIGIVLSFITVIIRMADPPEAEVGYHAGRDGFYPMDRMREARAIEGVVIYHFGGALFFGNIDQLQDTLTEAVTDDTKVLILESGSVSSIDVTASSRLRVIAEEFRRRGIKFYMCEHSASVNDQLREFGAEDLITSGTVRHHIENALTDAGIRKPYPLIQSEERGQTETSDESASRQIAEFEWAFGKDADSKMEEFAELIAKRMIDENSLTDKFTQTDDTASAYDPADDNLSAALEKIIAAAEKEKFGGHFTDRDEEHLLTLLEHHIDRLGRLRRLNPERLQRIEDRIIARHKRLADKLEKNRE